jgi:hypothetical protein
MTIRSISRKLMYSLFGAAIVLSVACKKDKNDDGGNGGPDPLPNAKKLVKIEEDANNYSTFEYNADGTTKKVTYVSIENGEPEENEMNFVYTDKKLQEAVYADGSKIKYVYEGSQVKRSESYSPDAEKLAYTEFTYSNGKVSSNTVYTGIEDDNGEIVFVAWMKTEYAYHSNGDIKETTLHMANPMTQQLEKSQVRRYEQYDSKVNPFASLGAFSSLFLVEVSARNPLVEKVYDANNNLQETIQNEYTYDNDGYPTQCKTTTTAVGEPADVSTTKFFYN